MHLHWATLIDYDRNWLVDDAVPDHLRFHRMLS
jgi:hypothetical protein